MPTMTTTSATRPWSTHRRNRPPDPRATRAASRHALREPSAACAAAARAARSAAAYARCRAARTPPTVMAMAATDQITPISASIHSVPEPRSRRFLIPVTFFANSLQTQPTRTAPRSPLRRAALPARTPGGNVNVLIKERPCPSSWGRPRCASAPSVKASANSNAAATHLGQVYGRVRGLVQSVAVGPPPAVVGLGPARLADGHDGRGDRRTDPEVARLRRPRRRGLNRRCRRRP